MAECCFTSTETVGLLRTGAQEGHLDFHTAPELCFFGRIRLFIFYRQTSGVVREQKQKPVADGPSER